MFKKIKLIIKLIIKFITLDILKIFIFSIPKSIINIKLRN